MRKNILLIRHGKTEGNLEGRYIGARTDESLCAIGRSEVEALKYDYKNLISNTQCVYSSPMKRSIETAEILFENHQIILMDSLKEIDFGDFENKNYKELNGNLDYQRWIDSGGKLDYPNGEKIAEFIDRSVRGVLLALNDMIEKNVCETAIVCHGGNIMAIMSMLTGESYFDFQVENAKGYNLTLNIVDGGMEIKNVDLISYSRI